MVPEKAAGQFAGQRLAHALTPFTLITALVALGLAFLSLYPLALILVRLFVNNGRLDLSALIDVFALPDLLQLLGNTVLVVVSSSLAALVGGSVLAWLNERTDARLGFATDAMPLLPFLLPPIAGAVGWALLLSPRAGLLNALLRAGLDLVGIHLTDGPLNIYSWWGLIFVYSVYQIPYVYLLVSAGLRNVDSSMEEQSRLCGAGLLATMLKVTLPAVRPSLGAAILLMVWYGFAQFSVPVIVGTGARIDVLAVRIVRLLTFTYPSKTALAVGLSAFVIVAVGTAWYFQGKVLKSGRHAMIGGRGHRVNRVSLGAWRLPARILLAGYVVVSAALPLVALLLVALNRFWTPDINWSGLSLDMFQRVLFQDLSTSRALTNSLLLGVAGATVGIVVAAIIALYVQRSSGLLARVLDAIIKLPAAISTMVMAIGFILAFSGPPFNLNGTFLILLLVYLVIYLPQASVAADAALSQVGRELPEASQVAGAGGGRTFRKVSFPLMLPGLAAGWALLFVRMAGDLTASAMLAGTSNPVVGFRILEIFENGSYPMLAALATVLTAISSAVVIVVLLASRRRASFGVATQAGV
jgi:iron(III) transport system permease protein